MPTSVLTCQTALTRNREILSLIDSLAEIEASVHDSRSLRHLTWDKMNMTQKHFIPVDAYSGAI